MDFKNNTDILIDGDQFKAIRVPLDFQQPKWVEMDESFHTDLMDSIVEYAYGPGWEKRLRPEKGYAAYKQINREAAKWMYSIPDIKQVSDVVKSDNDLEVYLEANPKFKNRGEMGELLLFYILNGLIGVGQLISKLRFRDVHSLGTPVHGFDAVHVDGANETLWVGEVKLYGGEYGWDSQLVDDLEKHINADYLNREFVSLKQKLPTDDVSEVDIEFAQKLFDTENVKLNDVVKSLKVVLFAAYTSPTISQRLNVSSYQGDSVDEAESTIIKRLEELNKKFVNKVDDSIKANKLHPGVQFVLVLMPLKDKTELVKSLHTKLLFNANA